MKKLTAAALVVSLIFLMLPASAFAEILPGFEQENTYGTDVYSDVPYDSWYYYYAGFAYEYGIMTGTSDGQFSPSGNLTLAEAITVAARLNAEYYGNEINESSSSTDSGNSGGGRGRGGSGGRGGYDYYDYYGGATDFSFDSESDTQQPLYVKSDPDDDTDENISAKSGDYSPKGDSMSSSGDLSWFVPYFNYAVQQGMISRNLSADFNRAASRQELAYLLYCAMPSAYDKINDISPIPDVSTDNAYHDDILTLYEAGVLTGSDEYGTFYPYSDVQRCEVAAMVSRAVNTDLRQYFTLSTDYNYNNLHFSWQYPYGYNTYYLDVSISAYDYNYFSSKPRTYDYASYAEDDADVTALTSLAEALKQMAIDNGYTSDYDIAGFVAAFVQTIEYQDDYAYKGAEEYPKYPIETLYEQGGDCEDTAVLLAKLMKLLGYGAVLLVSDDHMAVGLQTSANGNISFGGTSYYYIETTEPGWRIGEVPSDMMGVSIEIIYI